MEKNDGLERLCKIYLNLKDNDKEKIIKLGEKLLKSQKAISKANVYSTPKIPCVHEDRSTCPRKQTHPSKPEIHLN